MVLATGCAPSDEEGTKSALSGTKSANRSAGTDGQAAYLSDEAIATGCSIAAKYIAAQFDKSDKPIVLGDATAYAPPLTDDDASFAIAYLLNGEKGDATDPANQARARALVTLIGRNLFEQCPSIADLKAKRAFTPDPKQETPPVTPDGLFYTYDTLAVSLPLVDLERGQAFMWTATGCGPLCGGSGIEIFTRRSDGSWSRTDYMGLTIS
ncbi:MAG: hypothetical protein NBV60_05535 [Erythrobacter sp.]|nr:hypothetical protein [Erythrobacter sp.]